jgi:hypothetical protein
MTITFGRLAKAFLIVLSCFFGSICLTAADQEFEVKVAAKAHSGTFKITQKYNGDFIETIIFRDSKRLPVILEGYMWSGNYIISPNDKWILRIQKTGSGDNIGILYQVEELGRVSQVVGFNELMWEFSDRNSKLKSNSLYHTGIEKAEWDKTSSLINLTISGSNIEKSGDGIKTLLAYDVKKHIFISPNKESGAKGFNR